MNVGTKSVFKGVTRIGQKYLWVGGVGWGDYYVQDIFQKDKADDI